MISCVSASPLACRERGGLLSQFHVLAALAENFSNSYSCYFLSSHEKLIYLSVQENVLCKAVSYVSGSLTV